MTSEFGYVVRTLVAAACVVVGVSTMPVDVYAQEAGDSAGSPDEPAPTAEQRKLNDEAVRAIGAKDYTRAISYLEESLYLGELNITYLNLGRAYQLLGRCAKARAAFAKVSEAPKVEKPPAAFVESKARQYQAELDESCTEEDVAPEVEKAEASDGANEAVKTSEQAVAPEQPDEPEQTSEMARPKAVDAGGSDAIGWSATIGGLVMAGGGVGMHVWAESVRDEVSPDQARFDREGRVMNIAQTEVYDSQSRANTLDTIGLSMGIVGGLSTAAGIYLLWSDDADDDDDARSVTIAPHTGGAGFVVNGRF